MERYIVELSTAGKLAHKLAVEYTHFLSSEERERRQFWVLSPVLEQTSGRGGLAHGYLVRR